MFTHMKMSDRPLLTMSCCMGRYTGMNAPLMHSIWRMVTLSIHLSEMSNTMNSGAIIAKPNIAGKMRNAVKRVILRRMCSCRSSSVCVEANTGCATCASMPETNPDAMLFHFQPCVKLPTVFTGNILPKMTVRMFWLNCDMMLVMRILLLKPNMRLTGERSMSRVGRKGMRKYLPMFCIPV